MNSPVILYDWRLALLHFETGLSRDLLSLSVHVLIGTGRRLVLFMFLYTGSSKNVSVT